MTCITAQKTDEISTLNSDSYESVLELFHQKFIAKLFETIIFLTASHW